jgi:hypothetical protein
MLQEGRTVQKDAAGGGAEAEAGEMIGSTAVVPGDRLIVVKEGSPFRGKVGIVKSAKPNNKSVELAVGGFVSRFKGADLAQAIGGASAEDSGGRGKATISKRAMAGVDEGQSSGRRGAATTSKSVMRVDSNTVDLRGMDLDDAGRASLDFFGSIMRGGQGCCYLLHGHGASGKLKGGIRKWLGDEKKKKGGAGVVEKWEPASDGDGGDAFTKVFLR